MNEIYFSSNCGKEIPLDYIRPILTDIQKSGWKCHPMANSVGVHRIIFSHSVADFDAIFEDRLNAAGFVKTSEPLYPEMESCSWERDPVSHTRVGHSGVRQCVPVFK